MYGQEQEQQQHHRNGSSTKASGSNLREFHNAIFDALNPGPRFRAFGVLPWGGSRISGPIGGGGTVYVGQGARLYDLVGKWVPEGLVGWLIRRQEMQKTQMHGDGNGNGNGPKPQEREEHETEKQGEGLPVPKWGASSGSAASTSSESALWEKV